jgi:integrase
MFPDAIWRALKRTMKAAGVARGTAHTYRHVYCSFLANNNVPPTQAMKVLGHGSLDTVLAYYHVRQDELLAAVRCVQFDRLLSGKEVPV